MQRSVLSPSNLSDVPPLIIVWLTASDLRNQINRYAANYGLSTLAVNVDHL